MGAEVDVDDVVGHDPCTKIRRLLPHQVHQLGSRTSLLLMHVGEPMVLFGQGALEVGGEIAGRKAGVVFYLGR